MGNTLLEDETQQKQGKTQVKDLHFVVPPTDSHYVINSTYPNQFSTIQNPVQTLKPYEQPFSKPPILRNYWGSVKVGLFVERCNK